MVDPNKLSAYRIVRNIICAEKALAEKERDEEKAEAFETMLTVLTANKSLIIEDRT